MGTYLNPGKAAYEEAVNSEIFVDKTEMIGYLNSVARTKKKYVCVSRPRRFGKTMAADMLCAYYDRKAESRELFEKRKIAVCATALAREREVPWDEYMGQFDVIRLVMTDFFKSDQSIADALDTIKVRVLDELEECYPGTKYDVKDFPFSMDKFYRKSGRQFVIVIDEWDAVFRMLQDDAEGQRKYLDFLRDWLKDKPYVALAYMTGILPIKKYGKHSALNMFTEYSMEAPRQLAQYTGFTEDEVEKLCMDYGMNYADISNWYNGYVVSDRIPPEKREEYRQGKYDGHKIHIYSPLSVVESMTTGQIKNYWNKTETYEALAEYIRKDYDGLKDAVALLMDGGCLKIDTSSYQNDMTTFHSRDDVLSLLIHLGYLGYDDETGEVFIPNREILDEFRTSTKSDEWTDTFRDFEMSQELLKATWACDSDRVAELLEKAHDRAGNKTYNDESALSYAVRYAYYAAQKYYTPLPELDTGKGYADLVYLPSPRYPDLPVLLIELKYDKTAEGAISQIKKRNYPDRLEHYKGNILMVAINYDKEVPSSKPEFKHHSCVIEKA